MVGLGLEQCLQFRLGDVQFEQFTLESQPRFGGHSLRVHQVNEVELALFKPGLHQARCFRRFREDSLAVIRHLLARGAITL